MSTSYYKTAEDFDWYKYHPAMFCVTTGHLSHVELGVYRRILDHYWTSDNKLPRDSAEIAELIGEKVFNWRRYGITAPAGFENEEITIKVVEHILSEFFEMDEDGDWHHVWLDEYRKATDTQFKERSKASKDRAARQPRGKKGQFGKTVTATNGEPSPRLTDENTAPHGDPPSGTVSPAVEQSRTKGSEQLEHKKSEQLEHSKASDAADTLPEQPSAPSVRKPPPSAAEIRAEVLEAAARRRADPPEPHTSEADAS